MEHDLKGLKVGPLTNLQLKLIFKSVIQLYLTFALWHGFQCVCRFLFSRPSPLPLLSGPFEMVLERTNFRYEYLFKQTFYLILPIIVFSFI
jgi:hypothetical protein